MRVILVNARPDGESNPGGDTVQVDQTRKALCALGIEAVVYPAESIASLPMCDLVHVFNLQMPESAWRVMQSVRGRGLPLAFSPIYWEEYELWFGTGGIRHGIWHRSRRVLGEGNARRGYVTWQRAKERAMPAWRLQRKTLMAADALLPNSNAEASMLCRAFRLGASCRERFHVVPNGIDPELFLPPPKPDEQFAARHGVRDFILQVATVYPVKNQLAVLEALSDRPEPLVFIGHPHPAFGEYAAECRRRGETRGRVVFIDHVPHDQLPGVYALARVHVLPSWRETPGLASLEAAAAGCKVVTTSIGSAAEYFRQEAWYCDPGDIGSIRRAVLSAQDQPPTTVLRDRVLQEYTWKAAAQATRQACTAPHGQPRVGVATDPMRQFTPVLGMGSEGITAVLLEVEGQRMAYVIIDGNNMALGLRERLHKELVPNLVDEAEIVTTDTHEVNAISTKGEGYSPIGLDIPPEEIIQAVTHLVEQAKNRLKPVKVGVHMGETSSLHVMGEGTVETLTELIPQSARIAKRTGLAAFSGALLVTLLLLTIV